MENEQLKKQVEGNGSMSKEEFAKQADFEEKMRHFVKTMEKVKADMALEEASENDYNVNFNDRENGGQLSLSKEQKAKEGNFSPKQGYPSYEVMIDDLKENDPEKLAELKQKWEGDILEHAQRQPSGKVQFVWRDPMTPNPETGKPESALFRQLRLDNEKKRRKALGEK